MRAGLALEEGGGAQVRRRIGVLNCETGMGKTFDIGLERLTGGSEFSIGRAIHTINRGTSKNEGNATHAGARAEALDWTSFSFNAEYAAGAKFCGKSVVSS